MRWHALGWFALLSLSGCAKLAELGRLANADALKPRVSIQRMKLDGISFSAVDVAFVVAVENPSPLDIALDKFDWNLALASSPFLSGVAGQGLAVTGNGRSTFDVPVHLPLADILRVGKAVAGQDEVPYVLAGNLTVPTQLGPITVPVRHQGTVPALRAPKVKLTKARVASIDILKGKARLELDMDLSHEQASALNLSGFDYHVDLGGKQVATGLLAAIPTLAAGQHQTVTLPIDLQLANLGASVVQALQRKESLGIGLGGKVKVGTPWGDVPLNINETANLKLQ